MGCELLPRSRLARRLLDHRDPPQADETAAVRGPPRCEIGRAPAVVAATIENARKSCLPTANLQSEQRIHGISYTNNTWRPGDWAGADQASWTGEDSPASSVGAHDLKLAAVAARRSGRLLHEGEAARIGRPRPKPGVAHQSTRTRAVGRYDPDVRTDPRLVALERDLLAVR